MPIDTLPVELLISIFEDVQAGQTKPGDPTQSHPPQWRVIRQVCKHWHDVADGHPRLWCTVDVVPSGHTLDWVNLCLSNSGTAELEVRFHTPDVMPVACAALVAHAGRIRTIWAAGEETIRGLYTLRPLFLSNLPNVQELHFDDRLTHSARRIYDRNVRFVLTELLGDLSPARLPALHTISLRGIFLPWESPIIRHLRVFRVACWEEHPAVFHEAYDLPSDRFLHILASWPHLETLSLDVTNTDPHLRPTHSVALPVVALPRLHRLELKVNQFEARALFRPLLAHIRVPATCNIALYGSTHLFDRDPPAYADFLPLPLPDSAGQPCFPPLADAVAATWYGPKVFSCATATGAELRAVLRDAREKHRRTRPDANVALVQFAGFLARAPGLARLTLRTGVSVTAYAHTFRALPGLAELVVEYPWVPRREDVRALLSALTQGERGEGRGEVVLAGLRVLRLRGRLGYHDDDEVRVDVAECLRGRREAGVCELEVVIETGDVKIEGRDQF